jgi:4,5-dihydroxyphthalate decarboxylase
MTIPLALACRPYDRTMALASGQVRPKGIDLTFLPMTIEEIFWRMNRHQEFDASEMSMSSYMIRRSRGDDSFTAIPVFTSRFFRHNGIFVHAGAGIEKPEDLKGKRVGVPEYQLTAIVWVRGILEDDYGVSPSDIHWVRGGQEQPGRVEKLAVNIPGVQISDIDETQTLSAMLAAGEIDAFIGPFTPSTFDGVRVKRLFPNFREVEMDYYRRTSIFPIMHCVAIRKAVLEQYPWVARSLFDAFQESKDFVLNEYRNTSALTATVPWLLAELEATRAVMGDDFWQYGLTESNRKTLEVLARYSYSQGLAARAVTVDELFAASTLDEFKL